MGSLPEHIVDRIAFWEALEKKADQNAKPEKSIVVTLPDGKTLRATAFKTTPLDIANGISKSLAERVVVAKVDGEVYDAWRPLEADCRMELLDFESTDGAKVFWHSSSHVLGQALELLWGDAKLCIGPALEDGGFYYDVHMGDKKVHPTDFKSLEKIIDRITSKEKQPFKRLVLTKEEALEMFKFNPFKIEIINSKIPDGATCTAYRCGPLIDLCRGPHIPHTNRIKAFTVTKASASYWLAKASNPSLQRVYGMSFPDKAKLAKWKLFISEAEKRDHRKVGPAHELFFFNDLSPGSCFFLPHGARVYNTLMNFIRTQYRKRGYEEVMSPCVFNVDLWKTSGHWANYKDNMFVFKSEEQTFGLKPMNCPGHCLMFKHRLRSYRELPLRYADFGVLHRNELSGALSGLTRVRKFQQDDAHIFVRHDQIRQEVSGVLDMLQEVYGIFGFQFALQLSTRPEKYMGEIKLWDEAELALAQCLTEFCKATEQEWTINHADGAFYGPKIDIQLTDALGRKHQCATIQLDFQLPIRFELRYRCAEEGKDNHGFETPVIIHRAILGSVERMFAILLEHIAGRWPLFLSPRQAAVLTVSERHTPTAEKVYKELFDAGFYVELDNSANTIPKKIRDAQVLQWNYIIVVGDNEVEQNNITVRTREGVQFITTVPELLKKMSEEVANHK